MRGKNFRLKKEKFYIGGIVKMKPARLLVLIAAAMLILSCGVKAPGEKNTEIISASEALKIIQNPDTVLVDARGFSDYGNAHIKGAVNITRADIVVNKPFMNMLAPASQIEDVMGRKGIDNTMVIVAYDDNNNMDAARLWWTLKYYGSDNVKVVSGGLKALLSAGAEVSEQAAAASSKTYKIDEERKEMIAVRDDIKSLIDTPRSDAVIIDTRSKEEYEGEGTIPGSVLVDYRENNFKDGTYKPVQQIG